jgi:hypothetical protein
MKIPTPNTLLGQDEPSKYKTDLQPLDGLSEILQSGRAFARDYSRQCYPLSCGHCSCAQAGDEGGTPYCGACRSASESNALLHDLEIEKITAILEKQRAELAESHLTQALTSLAAMTEDRNLWQGAHDEDCPNLASLAAAQKELQSLQEQNATYKKWIIIKDCRQCHGSGEIINSEEGGMLDLCDCHAVRIKELRTELQSLRYKE